MATSLASILRWQFDLTWSLLDGHLQALSDEDYLWEPAPDCWTVRKGSTGFWSADWVEPEPDPAPVSTIGWTSWHIGWWWTEASAHLNGDVPAERAAIGWPGSAAGTVAWLGGLRSRWVDLLDGLTDTELAKVSPYPWPLKQDRVVAHTLGWVNAELMKNASEIGQLRFLRIATAQRRL